MSSILSQFIELKKVMFCTGSSMSLLPRIYRCSGLDLGKLVEGVRVVFGSNLLEGFWSQ